MKGVLMSKDKLLPLSIFALAFSILISSFIISRSINNNGTFISHEMANGFNNLSSNLYKSFNNDTQTKKLEEKSNFNLREAAEYLNISETDLINTVYNKESKIPYVKIHEEYIFNKEALDKWVQESGFNM